MYHKLYIPQECDTLLTVFRMCRIQLKLPVGGNSVVEMNRTDTLAMLRQRVAQVSTHHLLCITLHIHFRVCTV